MRRNVKAESTDASGGRAVQFGSITSEAPSTEESSSSDSEKEKEKEAEDEKDYSIWNERMRHQEIIRAEQAKTHACLENLISRLFIVVLERCLEALTILREMQGMSEAHVDLEYVPITEKYTRMEYDLHTEIQTNFCYFQFEKFRRDISWIEKVLFLTILNLRKSWNFQDLIKILNDDKVTREDEYYLLTAKQFNQREVLKLRQSQEAERDSLVSNIHRITEELGNLKDELNDSMVEYDVTLRFLKKWEAARYEQNWMVLKQQETGYENTTKKMEIEILREDRVHEEIELFLEEDLKDSQDAIEKWMDKYDAEIDQWEITINQRKVDVERQQEEYQMLLDKYEDRKFRMEEFLEYKRQKQKEAEEQERRLQAVTKIQSWWRGIMFRKGLGPWRRKKGKGKKGSGKNSGKKSKK